MRSSVGPRRARAGALALALLALSAPSAAQTSPQAEGRERYERGVDLFAQKDYGGALAEFQRAYQLTPYSVVLYNLGLTYAALGRPVEAVDTLQKVLDAPGSLSADRVAQARALRAEQAARIAEVTIVSNVEGARIEIDGAEVAKAPLAAPLRIKAGPHRVGAVLSGYVPSRKEVDVPAGTRTEVRFELVATDRRLGLLTVKTRLPGAQLLVDGEPVAVTPLPGPIALMPGQRKVELRREGYATARTELSVGEGANAEVSLEPEEDAGAVRAAGGQLTLDITETDAVVTVDGRARGAYLGALTLAPGAHRLRVERAGFFTVERDVEVARQRATTLRVELEPTADTRAAYTSKARTWRTLGWVGVGAGAALAAGGGAYLAYNAGSKSESDDEVAAFNRSATEPGGACNATTVGFDEAACNQRQREVVERSDEVYARDVFGWIGIGAGAAVLAAGVIVLVVGDDPGRYDRQPSDELIAVRRARPWAAISPGQGMVGLSSSF